jgi:MFS superfamily sulfate permease-like transporter
MSGSSQNTAPAGSGGRQPKSSTTEDKPHNGLPGLKHWRYDVLAGLQIALLGLPLSLGVAIASGAPPVAGVISAIIAGVVFSLLGGTYVTIGGPAVGLAPASLAGMLVLGQGNVESGYPLFLVAVCLAGAMQVLLSRYDVGRLAMYFPSSVLQGMLIAIGLLIIIQQLPALLGSTGLYYTRDLSESLRRLPDQISDLNQNVFIIGAVGLLILFLLNNSRLHEYPWIRTQSPLLVVVWGGVAGWMLQIPNEYLISVPRNILTEGIRFPDFAAAWEQSELWFAFLGTVIMLTLIDTTETLATIRAIDKIDPFKRRSDPDVTLRSVGVSTILSGLAGGLMIIPGGIKSTANIFVGGRTLWVNAYYAGFMAAFVWFGIELINRIPVTVLAALLIFIGWKLCAPRIFLNVFSIGAEQLLIATVCVVGTLYTSNILWGVLLGTTAKFLILGVDVIRTTRFERRAHVGIIQSYWFYIWGAVQELFRDPVIRIGDARARGDHAPVMSVAAKNMKHPYKIYLSSLSCMNLMKLDARLKALPDLRDNFMIILAGHVVDHTAMDYLEQFRDQQIKSGRNCVILGTQHFLSHSNHRLAYRVLHSNDDLAYG